MTTADERKATVLDKRMNQVVPNTGKVVEEQYGALYREYGNLRRLANVPHVEYRGQIDGKELEVWADEVPNPVQLRYLFSRPWKGMLYNEVGLPVGPFSIGSAERSAASSPL